MQPGFRTGVVALRDPVLNFQEVDDVRRRRQKENDAQRHQHHRRRGHGLSLVPGRCAAAAASRTG